MNVALVVAVVSAVVSLAGITATFKIGSKANATGDKKVDLEAHRDAMQRMQAIIDQQDKSMVRIQAQMDRVQDQLSREQDVSAAMREQVRILQEQIDELTRSRRRLEDMLAVRSGGSKTTTRTAQSKERTEYDNN